MFVTQVTIQSMLIGNIAGEPGKGVAAGCEVTERRSGAGRQYCWRIASAWPAGGSSS
jgi:hypothetical protein